MSSLKSYKWLQVNEEEFAQLPCSRSSVELPGLRVSMREYSFTETLEMVSASGERILNTEKLLGQTYIALRVVGGNLIFVSGVSECSKAEIVNNVVQASEVVVTAPGKLIAMLDCELSGYVVAVDLHGNVDARCQIGEVFSILDNSDRLLADDISRLERLTSKLHQLKRPRLSGAFLDRIRECQELLKDLID